MTETINRREILKLIGASGSIAITGTATASKIDTEPIRLVEVGLRYQLQEEHSYVGAHSEGLPGYYVDEETKRLLLTPTIGDARSVFEETELVVAAPDPGATPHRLTPREQTDILPTSLKNYHRPYERVRLEDPITPPRVQVEDAGGSPRVVAEGIHTTLGTDGSGSIELESRIVSVDTYRITDEIVEIAGVSDHRQGPKKEYDSVQVEAQPVIDYRYLTDVAVLELADNQL